jgi:NAD-dependent dihydropyrimidine dehydrogenase PreA subunit
MARFLKTIWGLLFRLFPCPTKVGLRRIGDPGTDSPVLVTCNFDLTVKRLKRVLKGIDVWLLVAESKGVNVWCAAGGEEFNTHSVVSAVKTSGIEDKVTHRTLVLPPLGAPGINAAEVRSQTGWKVRWGPVYGADIPRYLADNCKKDEGMKRSRYDLSERLDTALGSIFPIYLTGALGFLLFGRNLLAEYLMAGALAFIVFMSLCPWIPGRRGITKAFFVDAVLVLTLVIIEVSLKPYISHLRPFLLISLVMIPVYGLELGGLASTMKSDLDPFLARLGIGAVGNVAFAGTVRTELLNGYRKLTYNEDICIGCRSCTEVCPQGVWKMGVNKKAMFVNKDACTACRACLVQCKPEAIQAPRI